MVSLHQAAVDKAEPETKEELDAKEARTRTWTTIITWVLLNAIWLGVSQMPAAHPVMSHESNFVASHGFHTPDMLGLDRATDVQLSCEFDFINGTGEETVRLFRQTGEDEPVLLFEGGVDEDCPDASFSLPPGQHFILTQVLDGNGEVNRTPSKLVTADVRMSLDVYGPIFTEGLIAANALGLLLFLSERAIREWAARKELRKMANLPLHKRRQKEIWEALNRDQSGGERAEVEDLAPFMQADADAEKRRSSMREAFAAQSASEADGDTEEFADEEAIEQDDDALGPGSTEGLEGEVEEDPTLQTVRDIWDRIEDLE